MKMSPHPTHPTMTVYRRYYIYLSLSDPCFSICWNPLAPTFCPHPLIRSHFLLLLVVCWWWWKEEERSGIETERRERARNQQKHTHTTSTMCVVHGKGTSPSSNRYCIILCVYMCLRPKSLSDSWMENQNQLLFPSPPSSSSSTTTTTATQTHTYIHTIFFSFPVLEPFALYRASCALHWKW